MTCRKEIYVKHSRLLKQKYCSLECRRNDHVNIECKKCSKSFRVTPSKCEQKYCSLECRRNDHTYKIKCKRCGDETVAKRRCVRYCTKCRYPGREKDGINTFCVWCGYVVYVTKSRYDANKKYFCCSEHQVEWQSRNKVTIKCKVCGKEKKCPQSKIYKYCSIDCRDKDPEVKKKLLEMNLIQSSGKVNKLEAFGYAILDKIGVEYEKQVLLCDKFCVDALVKDSIVVQFDGDYWHGNPNKFAYLDKRQIKRTLLDKSQDAYLSKVGYIVLRFWESDVYKNSKFVVESVQNALSR